MKGEYAPVPPPSPSLNGGLYTGEPFQKEAPWGNVPITPDSGVIMFNHLPSSSPLEARYMMPGGGIRPGNNMPILQKGYQLKMIDDLNMTCVPESNRNNGNGYCFGSAATRNTVILPFKK